MEEPALNVGAPKTPKTRKVEKALVLAGEPLEVSAEAMWLQAIKDLAPTIGVEGIRELLKMKAEEEDRKAAIRFDEAMARVRAKLRPIRKSATVNRGGNAGHFGHETLADISDVADEILGSEGISYRYRCSSNPNEPVSVTCVLSGHGYREEAATLRAGADASGGKNSIQAIGSTTTYLQRYTLRLALGLATTKDDDGKGAGAPTVEMILPDQVDAIRAAIVDGNRDLEKFLKYFKVEKIEDLPAARYEHVKGTLGIK